MTGVNRSASELIASDGGANKLLRQGGAETGSQNLRYKVRQCRLQGSFVRGNADADHLYSGSA